MKLSATTLLMLSALAALSSAAKRRAGRVGESAGALNLRSGDRLESEAAAEVRTVRSLSQIKSAAISYVADTSQAAQSTGDRVDAQVESKWDLTEPGVLEQVMRGVNPDSPGRYDYAQMVSSIAKPVRFSSAGAGSRRGDPSALVAGTDLYNSEITSGGDAMNWKEGGKPKPASTEAKEVQADQAIKGKDYKPPVTQKIDQSASAGDLKVGPIMGGGVAAMPNCGSSVCAEASIVPVVAGKAQVPGIDVDDAPAVAAPEPGDCGNKAAADQYLGAVQLTYADLTPKRQDRSTQACQLGLKYAGTPSAQCQKSCVEATDQQEGAPEDSGMIKASCKWGCFESPAPKASGLEKMRQMILNGDEGALEKQVNKEYAKTHQQRADGNIGGADGPDFSKDLMPQSAATQLQSQLAGAASSAIGGGGLLGAAAGALSGGMGGGLAGAIGGAVGGAVGGSVGGGMTAAQQAAANAPNNAAMKASGIVPGSTQDGGPFDNGITPPPANANRDGAASQAMGALQNGDLAGAANHAVKAVPGLAGLASAAGLGAFLQVRSNSTAIRQ